MWVIHYSCSSIKYNLIRIGLIALRKFTDNQTYSFAMSNEENDDNKEQQILKEFFEHIKSNSSAQ